MDVNNVKNIRAKWPEKKWRRKKSEKERVLYVMRGNENFKFIRPDLYKKFHSLIVMKAKKISSIIDYTPNVLSF